MSKSGIFAVFSLIMLLQGCATITTGTSQSVTVETTPPGATCRMIRDGDTIGVVNPTPGTVNISKDMDPMEVSCELKDYSTLVEVVESNFQGATLGNIILGGGVGVVVDAASGAMNEYPKTLRFRMQPVSFATLAERDKYFDEIAKELRDGADELMKTRTYRCSTEPCKKNVEKLNKQLEVDLAKNEEQRKLAAYDNRGS